MKLSTIVSLIITCGFLCSVTYGQDTADQTQLPRVNNEVFKSIVQLYDYDKAIPLDVKLLGKQELPYGFREKIVFKGVNN